MTSSHLITSVVTESPGYHDLVCDYNKISTQLPRRWAALCLINYLIISNTVFQIVTPLSWLAQPGPE